MFSAAIIFASAIGSAFVQNWRSLIGLRALLGIGMGCKAAVVPVFAAEIAPAHLRGESIPSKAQSTQSLIYL
jgi:MFS family permease